MKFQQTAFLVTSLALVPVAYSNDDCPVSVLMEIASNPHVAGCSSVAGFSSISTVDDLTPETIKKICSSSDCMQLMEGISKLGLGECRIPEMEVRIQSDILDPFAERCSASKSTGSSSTDSSGSGNNLREVGSSSETSGVAGIAIGCLSMVTFVMATILV